MSFTFFDYKFDGTLIKSDYWFHNMPLPDGSRIAGANLDRNREQKLWHVFQETGINFKDKHVLDIGANDGYFSVAAALAGATVVAVNPNTMAFGTYPERIQESVKIWNVQDKVEIIVGNFMDVTGVFDIIMCFGVFYHLEDPLGGIRKIKSSLSSQGQALIETPISRLNVNLPVLEVASDKLPTTIGQGKKYIKDLGDGTFFIPNVLALEELSEMADLKLQKLPDENIYTYDSYERNRKLFILS